LNSSRFAKEQHSFLIKASTHNASGIDNNLLAGGLLPPSRLRAYGKHKDLERS
jgi:hypothetical protein